MNKIVQIARKQIGYTEIPANSNKTKYGRWFGLDGLPWCAILVSWCYAHAGTPLGNLGFLKGFAGCQTGYAIFKKRGWITDKPVGGDIVLYDWNSDGKYDHTGLFVTRIDEDKFSAIEGNTSLNNNSNGGQVMYRIRWFSTAIFVHVP